ncbi:hypothetical protein B484DRAFT_323954 [Ochromonadaceae sp. CCMP2298]|nr:hypothetical protein B484DRAFT_323954 [Ochromonadaceae sp. CCMP2298]
MPALLSAILLCGGPAHAGVDLAELSRFASPSATSPTVPAGDLKSQLQKVVQQQSVQETLDARDVEFLPLPSGASYREYRVGRGDEVVQKGSAVVVQMTVRCRSFATAKEPGGVKYYDSKVDSDGGDRWVVGSGQLPPALEEGLLGMKRGAVRRVELPSQLVFKARKEGQLPQARGADGQRRYGQLFKTDATLLFEVMVDKVGN